MKNKNILINTSRRRVLISSSIVMASTILLPSSLLACPSGNFGEIAKNIISVLIKTQAKTMAISVTSGVIAIHASGGSKVVLALISVSALAIAVSNSDEALSEISKLYTCDINKLMNNINKLN